LGKRIRQRTVFHGARRLFNVVGETHKLDPDALLVLRAAVFADPQHDVTASGIAVLWFADGPDIDGVTEVGWGFGAGKQDPVVGLMRMAEAHNIGIGILHDPHHALFFPILKKVFIDAARTAVDEEEVELVLIELEFDPDVSREGPKICAFIFPDDLVGIGDGKSTICLFFVGLVSAAAVVTGATYTEVIIPGNCWYPTTANLIDDLIRPDIVSDQVAQAIDYVRLLLLDACKEGFEGGKVGMYIAK